MNAEDIEIEHDGKRQVFVATFDYSPALETKYEQANEVINLTRLQFWNEVTGTSCANHLLEELRDKAEAAIKIKLDEFGG